MKSAMTKAAGRAAGYRSAIGELQAAGRDRQALAEALRWLRAEAVHAEKLRPRQAPDLYGRLVGQVSGLAEFITGPADSDGGPGARHRQALPQLQAAGQHRKALQSAALWLTAAAADWASHRDPAGAGRMYGQLTERITVLAAAIPGYRPTRKEAVTDGAPSREPGSGGGAARPATPSPVTPPRG